MSPFLAKMQANFAAGRYSCAGLDPVEEKIPEHLLERPGGDAFEAWRSFLYRLVMAAVPYAGAFKPNLAFFIRKGQRGLAVLESLCGVIRKSAPDALLILDMKVGDIGDTNHGYVRFAFEVCGADAVTVHPYMGSEAMAPFLKDPRRGVFVLCKTSNNGSDELQDMVNSEGEPFYLGVAHKVALVWNANRNCGLVTGATYPTQLAQVRRVARDLPLLIPGIGKQGGDLRATVEAAGSSVPFVINQSSSFMYASKGEDFADAGAEVLAKANRDVTAIMAELKQKGRH